MGAAPSIAGCAVASALLLASAQALADGLEDWSASGAGRFDVQWLTAAAPPEQLRPGIDAPRDVVTAGMSLRGGGGASFAQLALGLDWRLGGAAAPGGFAYAFHLRPLGFALIGGSWLRFSSTAGVGFDGIAPIAPFAVRLPIDALLELPAGDHLRFDAGAEVAWIATPEERRDGTPHDWFADEASAVFRVRLGDRYREQRSLSDSGNGYFFGAVVAERLDALFAGAVFGYALDGSYDPDE